VPEEDEKSLLFDVYASKLYMAMGVRRWNDMNANCKELKKSDREAGRVCECVIDSYY